MDEDTYDSIIGKHSCLQSLNVNQTDGPPSICGEVVMILAYHLVEPSSNLGAASFSHELRRLIERFYVSL